MTTPTTETSGGREDRGATATAAGPEQPEADGPSSGVGSVVAQLKDIGFWAENAAPIGLVGLVVLFSFLSPAFLTPGNIRAMLVAGAILTILAVAQAFVITTGGIDLSISATMTVGAIALGMAWAGGLGFALSVVVAVLAATIVGLVNGIIIAKGRVTDFIVTLGTLSAATGLALILSDGRPIPVSSPELLRLTSGSVGVVGFPVIIALVVAVLGWFVMFRTRFGLRVQAVGGNEESAVANGIDAARIRIAVYVIAGALAGLAALLLVARVGAAEPVVNTQFLLNSIAAVVLGGVALTGGKAKIVGPVLGALLLTALTNGLTLLGVSPFYQPLAVGIVVVLAALLTRYQKR